MIYEFQAEDGRIHEEWFDGTGHVPERIQRKGVKYKRIISLGALRNRPMVQKDIHFVSRSLPRKKPGVDHFHKGEFNEVGQPLFSKRSEVNEYVARANHETEVEETVYD